MKSYIIYSSERVYYRTIVEAENIEAAKENFLKQINVNDLETYTVDDWSLDKIECEDETEQV
jgi:hypothetical protein